MAGPPAGQLAVPAQVGQGQSATAGRHHHLCPGRSSRTRTSGEPAVSSLYFRTSKPVDSPFSAVCMRTDAAKRYSDTDGLTVGGGACTTRGGGSSFISDAEQAACAPLAAQVVTAGGGQPCDIFP